MERVSLALRNSALTTTEGQSQRRLPDAQVGHLVVLVTQMADRYPSQDLEQSIAQKFFPRPDEVYLGRKESEMPEAMLFEIQAEARKWRSC